MASEQIIIDYKVEVAGMRAQLKSVEQALKSIDETAKASAKNTEKHFESAGASIKQTAVQMAGALGVAFGVTQVIQFGKEAVALAGKLEGIEKAFNKLNNPKLLDDLRKATKGTVSDLNLMKSAVQANNFKLPLDQLAGLFKFATQRAQETGESVDYLTESIVLGISRKSIPILDNLGISAQQIQQEFQKTGDFAKAVGGIVNKSLQEQGDLAETTADKIAKLGVAWDEFKVGVGQFLIESGAGVVDFFEQFGEGATKAEKVLAQVNSNTQDFYKKEFEQIADNSKKSEKDRLKAIQDNEFQIQYAKEQGLKTQDINLKRSFLTEYQLRLKFAERLKNLDKERIKPELSDDEKKAIQDALDKRQGLLDELIKLDVKADQERVKEFAKTEYEKIELARGTAIQEVLIAEKAAIDAGVKRADATLISQNAISNINKTFNDKQHDLELSDQKIIDDEILAIDKREKEEQMRQNAEQYKIDIAEYKKFIEDKKKVEQEFVNFVQSTLSGIAQINTNIADKRIQETQEVNDAETYELQKQLDAKLITQEQYDQKKAELDKRSAEKEKEIKRRTFEANKQIMLIQTIMATAQATIAALGSIPYTPANIALAALTAAAGAVQIAVITSQPTPKFAKGGKIDGRLHSQGGTLIEAERDEMIINRNDAMKNDKLLGAINSGKGQQFIFDHYIAPALKAQQQKSAENKEKSFASNLANSMGLNFKDGNLLDSMKQTRKNDKEIALYLGKKIEGSQRSNHKW
jgi:hypothetical protein